MVRKFIFPLLLSLGTIFLFKSYFMDSASSVSQGVVVNTQAERNLVPGKPVSVPTAEVIYKPLHTDVVFSDQKMAKSNELVVIESEKHTATFSPNGGTLVSLAFKNHKGKEHRPLQTLEKKDLEDILQQQGAFLVAVDGATPFGYELLENKIVSGGSRIVFQAENDICSVKKTFMVHDDSYCFDVTIDIDPKDTEKPVTPRVFLPAPFMTEPVVTKANSGERTTVAESSDDAISIFSWDEAKQSVETYEPAASQALAWFWLEKKPLFGLQDRYFVHALIADSNNFVQRGYLKRYSNTQVSNIIEGPAIEKKTSWTLSFYMGPKTVDDLQAADERLSSLLSFGILSPICKLLIALLDYLYSLLGSFGLAIIVMTILLQVPLSPLMIYAKKKQEIYARYEPSLARISLKYRHDKVMQEQELMRFHKEHNISPAMKIAGCLPQLLRMPIMFGLFRVLSSYIGLYQAPLGGWVTDLSSRDPFYVLPFLTCLSMLWMNKQTTFAEEKQRVMAYFISIVVAAVFATFSAGLCLYWLVGNLVSIGEEYVRRLFFK